MKNDKALMLYKNNAFVDYIIDAVSPISNTVTLVSSKKNHHQIGYPYINDLQLNKGPVSAITSALTHTNSLWNLIVCCDTPLIKTSFFRWLVQKHDTNFNATVGYIGNKKMPLTAIYHKNCNTEFSTQLKLNKLKVMSVLKDLNINYVAIPNRFHSQLTNVNTPEQLKSLSV